ncbi:hypothetical protein GCM10009574_013460 [Streptomyces asiaticus]
MGPEGGEGGEELLDATVVAAEGGDGVRVGFLDGGGEDGVGAGFEVEGVAVGVEGVECVVEADGFVEVAVPVLGVEGVAVDGGGGDGGVQRDVAGAGGDGRGELEELLPDAVDVRSVGRVVDRDGAGAQPGALGCGGHLGEPSRGSGDDGGGGPVDGRDPDVIAAGQQLARLLGGRGEGDHSAVSCQLLGDEAAAECHEPCAILQRERTGHTRGRDLAL